MANTVVGIDGGSLARLVPVIGKFTQLAVAEIDVSGTSTSETVTFPQLQTILGVLGLTVRTKSTGAIRTNIGLTATWSGNVLTLGESGAFDIDADECLIDVLVWGQGKLG